MVIGNVTGCVTNKIWGFNQLYNHGKFQNNNEISLMDCSLRWNLSQAEKTAQPMQAQDSRDQNEPDQIWFYPPKQDETDLKSNM